MNTEADQVIDAAARFVAFGRRTACPRRRSTGSTRRCEAVYKGRFPEDAALDGLKKILADKGVPAA